MCEFCKDIAKDDKEFFDKEQEGKNFIFQDKEGFGILAYTGDSGCLGCIEDIKFCPYCGRKLSETED